MSDTCSKYRCCTCEGTGEVHNHNTKCWDCRGKGVTDHKTAESAIRSQIIPEMAKVKGLAKEQFDKDTQDLEVARLLKTMKLNDDSQKAPDAADF